MLQEVILSIIFVSGAGVPSSATTARGGNDILGCVRAAETVIETIQLTDPKAHGWKVSCEVQAAPKPKSLSPKVKTSVSI